MNKLSKIIVTIALMFQIYNISAQTNGMLNAELKVSYNITERFKVHAQTGLYNKYTVYSGYWHDLSSAEYGYDHNRYFVKENDLSSPGYFYGLGVEYGRKFAIVAGVSDGWPFRITRHTEGEMLRYSLLGGYLGLKYNHELTERINLNAFIGHNGIGISSHSVDRFFPDSGVYTYEKGATEGLNLSVGAEYKLGNNLFLYARMGFSDNEGANTGGGYGGVFTSFKNPKFGATVGLEIKLNGLNESLKNREKSVKQPSVKQPRRKKVNPSQIPCYVYPQKSHHRESQIFNRP
jgi:hypothetical protein